MAIDIATTSTTRITGPLAQPNADPYSMLAEVVEGQEYVRVTVPGVLLHDPEFASGYYHGRCMYFEDVRELFDRDGKHVQCYIRESQLPVKEVKVRDITDQQVMDAVTDIMRPENEVELQYLSEPATIGWRAGMIFGYVHACVETAQAHKQGFPYHVTTETAHHRMEVSDGCLTIGEQAFPDRCISLSPEETDQALEVLLAAQTGFTPIPTWEGSL